MPRGNSNILRPKIPRIFANKNLWEKQNMGNTWYKHNLQLYTHMQKLDETPAMFSKSCFCKLSQQTYLCDCSKRDVIWWNLVKVTLLQFGNDVLRILTYRAIVWYSVMTYTCIKKFKIPIGVLHKSQTICSSYLKLSIMSSSRALCFMKLIHIRH